MRPKVNDDTVKIPLTFDVFRGMVMDDKGKSLWLMLSLVVWLSISFLVFLGVKGWGKLFIWLGLTTVFIWVVRFVIMRETYFKKKRQELLDNEYMFGYDTFWDIYDIQNTYPYFVSFNNGTRGLFVQLDKDVVVGKSDDAIFHHHTAIADAYKQMVLRNISCVHIDYMDVVGRDDRMDYLFNSLNDIDNPELKRVLMRTYSNIQYIMDKSYASYDVYCFIYRGPTDIFWDELQAVLRCFMNANYIRFRVLNKDTIGLVTKVMLNIDTFSVNKACEDIFKKVNGTSYLRTIWVENDGERVNVNKTLEEMQEYRRVAEAEKVNRKGKNKIKVKKGKKGKGVVEDTDDNLELF